MATLVREHLVLPPGCRSKEAAWFIAQLDDQSGQAGIASDAEDVAVPASLAPSLGLSTLRRVRLLVRPPLG